MTPMRRVRCLHARVAPCIVLSIYKPSFTMTLQQHTPDQQPQHGNATANDHVRFSIIVPVFNRPDEVTVLGQPDTADHARLRSGDRRRRLAATLRGRLSEICRPTATALLRQSQQRPRPEPQLWRGKGQGRIRHHPRQRRHRARGLSKSGERRACDASPATPLADPTAPILRSHPPRRPSPTP